MARKILRDWLSGEKTLPESVQDWLDDHSRRELASVVGIFIVQAIIGSLLVSVTIRTVELSVTTLRSVSPATAVVVVLLSVVTVEVTALLVEVRRVGRLVERLDTEMVGGRNVNPRAVEGKLDSSGVKIDDTNMNQRTNGGEKQ